MEQEIWSPLLLEGMEKIYEITPFGAIRKIANQKILSLHKHRDGYLEAKILGQFKKVHHLVALTFIGPRPFERAEINHKDFNKENNHYTNLEWCTHQQNITHSIKRMRRGEGARTTKLTEIAVQRIRKSNLKQKELASIYGVTRENISYIKAGKTWRHI